jgi:GTP-binding protein
MMNTNPETTTNIKTNVTISILGRPNVGKSTLFNRLIKKQEQAITYDRPGVTRDRHFGWIPLEEWDLQGTKDHSWLLVDTGGFYPESGKSAFHFWQIETSLSQKEKMKREDLFARMEEHIQASIDESDLLLIVVDAREGYMPHDRLLLDMVRKKQRPFLVIVNKVDGPKQELSMNEFYQLGLSDKEILGVSAAHGRFLEELRESMAEKVQTLLSLREQRPTLKSLQPKGTVVSTISLVGAPNAGKSTLLNRLLGEDRSLVSPIPGTTLDPVVGYVDLYIGEKAYLTERQSGKAKEDLQREQDDHVSEDHISRETTEDEWDESNESNESNEQEWIEHKSSQTSHWRSLKVIDTAGIRRKAHIHDELESLSVYHALKNIDQSDVVIYVIDAYKGPSHQDARLCEVVLEKGKALIICLNKMDLLESEWKGEDFYKKRKAWWEHIQYKFSWLHYCNFIPLSAKKGTSLQKLKDELRKTLFPLARPIPTGALNRTLAQLFDKKSIPLKFTKGKAFKIKYASQVKTNPPTFLVFTNYQQHIPEDYRRYLANGLRDSFPLKNVPIHFIFRSQSRSSGSSLDLALEDRGREEDRSPVRR